MKPLEVLVTMHVTVVRMDLTVEAKGYSDALNVIARNSRNTSEPVAISTHGVGKGQEGRWLLSPEKDRLVFDPVATAKVMYRIDYSNWKIPLGSELFTFAYLTDCSELARKLLDDGHTINVFNTPDSQTQRLEPSTASENEKLPA